jgi:hypothetical protein
MSELRVSEVADALEALAQDDLTMKGIASLSYRHANGFFKLVLHRSSETGAAIRLHAWMPDQVSAENIHNHRWPFVSRVLLGHVDEYLFEFSKDGEDMWRYSYERIRRGAHVLHPVGRTTIKERGTQRWERDSVYIREALQLHRVRAAQDRLTATLVACAPTSRDSTDVFTLTEPGIFQPVPELPLGAQQARDLLLSVAKAIRSGCRAH